MASVIGEHKDGVYEKRWALFRVRPGDLLNLLQFLARQDVDLNAEPLPPDVRVADAFYDMEQEQCVLVLESAFYSPVQARLFRGNWSGGWDDILFSLEEDAPPPVRPRSLPPDVRWEALFIPTDFIPQTLQAIASGARFDLPAFPPDTRIMDAFYDGERGAFVLFLESSFFDKATIESANGETHVQMPERPLNLTRRESPSSGAE